MPDVDSTFRTTGRWKYIIVSDLKNAFHQNHLAKPSLKYCSKVSLYLGIRVYTRCAMGMPGSKTTLEVVIFIVLENCLQDASRWSVLWRTNSKRTTLQPVKGTWVPNTKKTSFVQNHHMPSFNHPALIMDPWTAVRTASTKLPKRLCTYLKLFSVSIQN